MNVFIAHYNTPELIWATIISMLSHTRGIEKIIVFDNSDVNPFVVDDRYAGINIDRIDNTSGRIIDFNAEINRCAGRTRDRANYGSAKHAMSVQWFIENYNCPFILADSDIIVRKDISELFDERLDCCGKLEGGRPGVWMNRILPHLCFINGKKINELGIRFYNRNHMVHLVREYPKWDTAAWFYFDLVRHHANIRQIDINEYVFHLVGGSWKHVDIARFIKEHAELL